MSTGAVSEAVAKVEAELGSFWSTADTSTGKAVAKVRASTLNLVVLSAVAEVERLRAETIELADTRAGRVFLATSDGRLAPWEVATEVSATCRKEGDDVICHDRIELAFGAMAAGRAASVLSSLSLSEVPTVVEVGRGAPATLVNDVVRIADRVVVDSRILAPSRIAEIAGKTRAPLSDRAFVRMFSFRELVARFFDGRASAARAVESIAVSRTTGGEQDPAALLVGWLASRLGLSFETRTRAKRPDGGSVTIEVTEDPRTDAPRGAITQVVVRARFGGGELVGRCARTEDAAVVAWSLETPSGTADQKHALGFHDETWVLLRALDTTEADAVYRQAALAAADWSGR